MKSNKYIHIFIIITGFLSLIVSFSLIFIEGFTWSEFFGIIAGVSFITSGFMALRDKSKGFF